jgi:hypothetical protein
MKKTLQSLLGAFLIVVNLSNIKANTIVVQNNSDSSTGSLRQSIIAANNGDTIRFNSSLIASGSNTISLVSEIAFSKELVIIGLYNVTDTLFISGNNTNRIFNISNTPKVTLDSMVFVDGNVAVGFGGGLQIAGVDSVCLNNSFISNCFAPNSGGLDFRTNSSNNGVSSQIMLDIDNSTIINNSTTGTAGGIFIGGSNITLNIDNSKVSNNSSTNNGDGGAISAFTFYAGSVIINNSNINNNQVASGNGGGIKVESFYDDFYTTINNSTFNGNTTSGTGGAIYSIPKLISSVTINSSTISNNTADLAGGIHSGHINSSQSLVTLTNSTVADNHATNDYGGIASVGNSSYFVATNSTIHGNTTATSFNKCGGVYVFGVAFGGGTSSLDITSSIVWTSIGDNIKHLVVDGGGSITASTNPIVSGGYNIFSNAPNGATATGDLTNVSAGSLNLQTLYNNGGITETKAPAVGSVAINAGNPTDMSDAQNTLISGVRDIGSTESVNVLVSSITVQGVGGASTITTQGGILQMEASVLPTVANDTTYAWSVASGTGLATISSTGLLTAITDGLVTVTATANDASGITGTAIITISNQIVLVSSITVQGVGGASTITTQGGILQMEASVLPTVASDTTYTWNVASGTGSAIISSTGLLTALSDGTVTVTATANDASGVTGMAIITISNQTVSINELNSKNLTIYPNPVKNNLVVELVNQTITEINVVDLTGKTVKSNNGNTNSINVTDLTEGVYLLRLITEHGLVIKKFIKN